MSHPETTQPQVDPCRTVLAGLLSEVGPGIAHRARTRHRKRNGLGPVGMVVENGSINPRTQYRGLGEVQRCYREEISQAEVDALALRLGVPAEFLTQFDPGWCCELGAVTIGTVDWSMRTAGIEPIPLQWPEEIILDSWPLHGKQSLIAVPRTQRRGKPLFVSGDWRQLYTEWLKDVNVAYKSDDALDPDAASAIKAACKGLGATKVVYDLDSWMPTDPASNMQGSMGAGRSRTGVNAIRREGFPPR